jgi:hypothetical protein
MQEKERTPTQKKANQDESPPAQILEVKEATDS